VGDDGQVRRKRKRAEESEAGDDAEEPEAEIGECVLEVARAIEKAGVDVSNALLVVAKEIKEWREVIGGGGPEKTSEVEVKGLEESKEKSGEGGDDAMEMEQEAEKEEKEVVVEVVSQ
jgi:orotate phosphoribosyltransferase